MTVQELITHLQTLPQDHEIYFRGYGCGSVWHAPARVEDFIEQTHLLTDKAIVEITADWN